MLKRLELIGFKSFADRTWFTFAPGLTAIVGPNGSGKSNVVDAVKWILGEQSAKSLRGGEMADVIFNGSSSRRAVGIAEVTLTLENSSGTLNTDAAEIAVTRRVHRDGTGEYLINGQASRLRDVRELFLGSGAGSSAYCIIEQGRVDALLQASSKERRSILEEAAGISRFKARKNEALRKLEHTAENLTRLRDIHGEVDARLRRVRLDAEKARKFQEYSTRLKDLRMGLAMREYHVLTLKFDDENNQLEAMRTEMTAAQVQTAVWDAEAQQLEASVGEADADLLILSDKLGDVRRQIVLLVERQMHDLTKADELTGELTAAQRRSLELVGLVRGLNAAAEQARLHMAQVEGEAEIRRDRVAELDAAAAATETELVSLRNLQRDGRERQFHLVGRAAGLNSEAANAQHQLERLRRDRDRKRRESESKTTELAAVVGVLSSLGQRGSDLKKRLALARDVLAERSRERDLLRAQVENLAVVLEDLRVRRSGLSGRIDVLENLEKTQEGLGTGVREVLADLASGSTALTHTVVGLVADSLAVPRDIAPLVDLVLGDVASHFVVRNTELLDSAIASRGSPYSGRVSFVPLVESEPLAHGDDTKTLDRWITCDHPELAGLPRQLLGRTLVVADLAAARQAAHAADLAGYRFVTRAGELLAPDGTLTIGAARIESGIVSRKSELRDLRSQAEALDIKLNATEHTLATTRDEIEAFAGPIHGLEEEIRVLTSNASDLQQEVVKLTQHSERLTDDVDLIRQDWELLEEEIQRLEEFWRETRGKADEAERHAEDLRVQIENADHAIRVHEHERAQRHEAQTAARVALAETTQRLSGLSDAFARLTADLQRADTESERLNRHEAVLNARLIDCELSALRAAATAADAHGLQESIAAQASALASQREAGRARRTQLLDFLTAARHESQQFVEQFHARELAARDIGAARIRIVERIREEYQIELTDEYRQSPLSTGADIPGDWDGAAATKEVEDLRKKIRHLGNVSLEALVELDEVEKRARELAGQISDLAEAESSLRAVIGKINEDSKKLFTETYDSVRAHFQELFRKLFGGGMADVVLDNPEDVLETGVDIIARPPGKELRGLSLMSGGEKTLTAVALLLAIFRSKPSPFCLLDEVDAALDEANTERLAQTIRDFTTTSQFIVITHKNRTMSYADVLYGVTMQESGVSRQIGVRFDDWTDEEQRSRAA